MTNTKASINVKIDADTKREASQLLARMGIDQTTAIDMYYKQIIKERRLPFQPEVAPTLDEQLLSAIQKRNPKYVELATNEDVKNWIEEE